MIDNMNEWEKLKDANQKGGKVTRTLPDDYDLLFIRLCDSYANSNSSEREELRSRLKDSGLHLPGFGFRLAILAERDRDKRKLGHALTAYSIDDFRDYRCSFAHLAVINHICEVLGVAFDELIESAIEISSSEGAKYFRDFQNRDPDLKTLDTFHIEKFNTKDGPNYRTIF